MRTQFAVWLDGIGLQDLIVAALVTERAKERGLGTVIEL